LAKIYRAFTAFLAGLFIWTNFIAQTIAGGYYHSLTLCSSGSVMTVGSNEITPAQIGGLSAISAIAAGEDHSLFLKNDGTVWAFGNNNYGQLGDGTTTARINPVQVTGLTGIISIAAGENHSLFLKNNGTVWACGYNAYGQLGDGTQVNKTVPTQVSGLSGIKVIGGGADHSHFLKNDGKIWACGKNFAGQLGDGTTSHRVTPVPISGLSGIIAFAGGYSHSLFLKSDGTVLASGSNWYGQFGDGTLTDRIIPTLVNGMNGISAVSAGMYSSLFLKNDGTVWACGFNNTGQLGDGTSNGKITPVQVIGLVGITGIASGRFHSLFLKNDGTVWACGYNTFGQLGDSTTIQRNIPVQTINLCQAAQPALITYPHFIQGYLYDDSDASCSKQSNEQDLSSFAVAGMPGNFYAFSNDSGHYFLGINDSVNYAVLPIIPQRLSHMIRNPCPSNYAVYLNPTDPIDTSGFNFGFDYAPCQQLRTDVSSDRRRRCFRNNTWVFYTNEGLIAANNVEVRVKFDLYDIPLSASKAYTWDAIDSSIVFNIGTLNAQQGGYISIIDSIACVNGITGLTQCTKVWILPPNQCFIDSTTGAGWDLSSMTVEGSCANDTVRFVILNYGIGDMTTPSQYRIYANNVLQSTNSFQLNNEDSLVVTVVSNGATIRLEADQIAGHPGHSQPRATVEACGTNSSGASSRGQVNQAAMDDEDVDIEIDCMQIRDSYDPNEKDNSPVGVNTSHIVLQNTLIDYIIHFQNTGSDTAFKIMVVDTLSSGWDLSTLEPGAASHTYKMSISGEGKAILKFTFDNINLVDSTTNEAKSHGFVKYKIKPQSTVALGTQINNAADIYFDYNPTVRTNTTFVTIDIFPPHIKGDSFSGSTSEINVYPNPTTGTFQIKSVKSKIEKIEVFNVLGETIYFLANNQQSITIDLSSKCDGIYFLNCKTNDGVQIIKLIKQEK
jgi:alpha-tubulin suppressor-like RCC1 family protein